MKRSSLLPRLLLILCVVGVGLLEMPANSQTNVGGGAAMSVPDCPDSAGNHLNYTSGTMSCGSSAAAISWLSGTTGSIGGGLLLAGTCTSGTVNVAGATVGTPVTVSSSDGTNIPVLGVSVSAVVTAADTVTVSLCAIAALTPAAKTYNVRVIQ